MARFAPPILAIKADQFFILLRALLL